MNEGLFYWKDHIYTSCFYSSFPYNYTQTSHFFTTLFHQQHHATQKKEVTTQVMRINLHIIQPIQVRPFLQNTIKSNTSFHQNYIILWCICTSIPTLIPANKLQCTKLVETLQQHSQASIPYSIYKSVRDRPVNDTII